jgi:hypothetical protein
MGPFQNSSLGPALGRRKLECQRRLSRKHSKSAGARKFRKESILTSCATTLVGVGMRQGRLPSAMASR